MTDEIIAQACEILQLCTLVATSSKALVPDPCDTYAAWRRYYHHDISELELSELVDELHALRPFLWGLPRNHWLRERVRVLENELTKRKYAEPQLPKPKSRPSPRVKHQLEGVKL